MILALGISIHQVRQIGDIYEFDNRYWNVIDMKWEMINDTWEEEI